MTSFRAWARSRGPTNPLRSWEIYETLPDLVCPLAVAVGHWSRDEMASVKIFSLVVRVGLPLLRERDPSLMPDVRETHSEYDQGPSSPVSWTGSAVS